MADKKSSRSSTSTKSSSTSKSSKSSKSTASNEKLSPWQRFLCKLKRKDKEKSSKDKPAPPRKAQSRSKDQTFGEKQALEEAMENWSKQRHMPSLERHRAVTMLQQQVEQYEGGIERRRQRLLLASKSTVFAVTGGKTALKATDDALPYEPKHVNWNQVLEKAKQVRQAKVTAKENGAAELLTSSNSAVEASAMAKDKERPEEKEKSPTELQSARSSNKETTSPKTTSNDSETVSTEKTGDAIDEEKTEKTKKFTGYSARFLTAEDVETPELEEDPDERSLYNKPTDASVGKDNTTKETTEESWATDKNVAEKVDQEDSSTSSTSSSKSESSIGQSMQMTDLLVSMITEANNSSTSRDEDEQLANLSPVDLMELCRNNPDKFDKLISDNTKQTLFTSQPTAEETDRWNKRRARHVPKIDHPIKFVDEHPKALTFCLTCKPRHPNYPYFKKN